MFKLTREVRFSLNGTDDPALASRPLNGFGGHPAITGIVPWMTLAVTLRGEPDAVTGCVLNIKDIDLAVRQRAVPLLNQLAADRESSRRVGEVPARLAAVLRDAWPGASLHELKWGLTPFFQLSCVTTELPMIRLSQKFEFSAAHRLHNPGMTDAQNIAMFGKCNNPHGHGHNYELEVTLAGLPDDSGSIIAPRVLEETVDAAVIRRLDHKHLNVEVPEFSSLIPSVENIAKVVFGMLKDRFAATRAGLVSVTVWETPKTWCEYSE